jgi:hypothetical protein
MVEQGYNDFLFSSREMDSFELAVKKVKNYAEVLKLLQDYDLSEKDFLEGRIPGLPPDEFPMS